MPSLLLMLSAFTLGQDLTYDLTLDCAILSSVGAELLDTRDPKHATELRGNREWAMPLVRTHAARKKMTEAEALAFVEQRARRYRDAYARATDAKRESAPLVLGLQADGLCQQARSGWAREQQRQ